MWVLLYLFVQIQIISSVNTPQTASNFRHLLSCGTIKFVPWTLLEFYFNRGLQRPYTSTCIILQKTINGFLCLLIVFLKSKTHQLNLKDVIKLNRNLR